MVTVRWGRSELATPASFPKVRWGRSEVVGSVPAGGSKVRWGRSEVVGNVGAALLPFTNIVGVEPLSAQPVTARFAVGSATPDSLTWVVVGGAPTTIIGTGTTVSVIAPAGLTGASSTIRVTPYVGSVPQPYQDFQISALPQTDWYAYAGGLQPIPKLVYA